MEAVWHSAKDTKMTGAYLIAAWGLVDAVDHVKNPSLVFQKSSTIAGRPAFPVSGALGNSGTKMILKLLEVGIDPNKRYSGGLTLLHMIAGKAIERKKSIWSMLSSKRYHRSHYGRGDFNKLVPALIKKGANPYLKNCENKNVLEWTTKVRSKEIKYYLGTNSYLKENKYPQDLIHLCKY